MNLLVIVAVLVSFSVDMARSKGRSFNLRPSGEECVSGDGSDYRGSVSKSESGKPCFNWKRFTNIWGASLGIGNHNYCRNPDHSLRPWCGVRKGRRIVQEFCNISKCSTPVWKPAVEQTVDTEQTCGQKSEQRTFKIVGGSFTPIESQPWVAAIYRRKQFLCGGSLIAPCWVLTAAHCFDEITDDRNRRHLSVYLGKKAINETNVGEQKFTVEKLVTHSNYDSISYDNDIALLKIKSKVGGCAVKSSATRTVCLPPHLTQLPAGFQCSIAGYGQESYYTGYSKYLKEGHVSLLSDVQCRRKDYYGARINGNMFCAARPDWTIDACKGDSGGPLACEVSGRMFLFGVVSWGEGCAKKNKPGVYTKVTNYNKWIEENTGLPKYTAGIMYPTK